MARSSGEQFGPTVPAVFAQWIAAGRVTPDTLVWRTGWPDWRRADAANADLPAPLPGAQSEPPPPPIPGATLPPPVLAPRTESSPTIKPSGPVPPTAAYNLRKRQQAKRRRMITVVLALVCLVLAGLLAVMTMSGGDTAQPAASRTP